MSGFSFPPPPPPPPIAANPSPQQNYRGGYNNRGSRGRGRGHARGNFQRGGHQQYSSFASRNQAPPPSHGHSPGQASWSPRSSPAETGHQNRQNGLANGFTPTYDATRNVPLNPPVRVGFDSEHQLGQGSSAFSGFKRKHEQAFTGISARSPQEKPESKPKVPAAPVVPSFGFSLPPKPPPLEIGSTQSTQMSNKKKQKKTNILGLTPKGDIHEDSDVEVDEEAVLAQSDQPTSIQHRGRSIQLNSAADVAAWIAERRKQYPTQAKVAAQKAAQDAARQKMQEARELEKQRRLEERDKAVQSMKREKNMKRKAKDRLKREDEQVHLNDIIPHETIRLRVQPQSAPKNSEIDIVTQVDDPLARIALLEEQLRQAREALARGSTSEFTPAVKPESVAPQPRITIREEESDVPSNDVLPLPLGTDADEENAVIAEVPRLELGFQYNTNNGDSLDGSILEVSSEEPSSGSSDSDSDSDAPPDKESSSKVPVKVEAPGRDGPNKLQICKQFSNTGKCRYGDNCLRSHEVICRYFARHGNCRYGDKCRMSHDVIPKTGKGGATSGERTKILSLRERMVELELQEEAKLGVQVIKQLGESGFFNAI